MTTQSNKEEKKPSFGVDMILRDILDTPAPTAHISRYNLYCDSRGCWRDCWYIKSLAKGLPAELDQKFYTLEDAVEAAEDFGYVATYVRHRLSNELEAKLVHPPTKTELDRLIDAAKTKWEKAKPCYVRFGKLPPGGRSKNHADDTLEAGVSVYHGERLPNGEARAVPSQHAEGCGILRFLERGTPLYIVAGDEIGVGSDGEPLLQNARVIRRAR